MASTLNHLTLAIEIAFSKPADQRVSAVASGPGLQKDASSYSQRAKMDAADLIVLGNTMQSHLEAVRDRLESILGVASGDSQTI